jgi:hypothetical protein
MIFIKLNELYKRVVYTNLSCLVTREQPIIALVSKYRQNRPKTDFIISAIYYSTFTDFLIHKKSTKLIQITVKITTMTS